VVVAGDVFDFAHRKNNICAVYCGGRLVPGPPEDLAARVPHEVASGEAR
jgi:hypothetical protein